MNDEIRLALREYAAALGVYARCSQSVPDYLSGTSRRIARTTHGADAILLPSTGRPIRGLAGVKVELVEPVKSSVDRSSLSALVAEAIPYSASGPNERTETTAPCLSERAVLNRAFLHVRDALFRGGNLAERIADGVGYKTYEPEQLPQRIAGELASGMPMTEVSVLGELFRNSMDATQSRDEAAASFDRWDLLVNHVIESLEELEKRQFHSYKAVVYLNGPLCDFAEPYPLVGSDHQPNSSVLLAPATDDDISRLVEGYEYSARLPTGLYNCNSVLHIPLQAPVLGRIRDFESLYPLATDLAVRAVDVLRIVHGEDFGIVGMTIESAQFAAPGLRQTYHTKYNPSLSSYLPHRVAYPTVPTTPIGATDLRRAEDLMSRHMTDADVKGFAVALRRFRDAWERHWPDNPERLLDIAIALEAIYLNDGKDKELRHRLSLRAARFLDPPGPERAATFAAVRQLYDLRSQVAHGATLANLSATEQAKLTTTMTSAPAILRRTMEKLIDGFGPVGLAGDRLSAYWQELELS